MKSYKTNDIRNVTIVGHSGCGKTSLIEALLFKSKTIERLGKIEEGNTITDFEQEEKKRKISISTAIAPLEYKNSKINFIDTPGYFDFAGETIQGLKAGDMALILLSSSSGVKVGTEKYWKYAQKNNLPRAFFINKLDREHSDFEKALSQLKEKFGVSVVPIQYPIGEEESFKGIVNVITGQAKVLNKNKLEQVSIPDEIKEKVEECKNMVIEAVAETDEELLEKYFSEGTLSNDEIYKGLLSGVSSGEVFPVMCGSALKTIGIEELLEEVVDCFPSPNNVTTLKGTDVTTDEEKYVNIDENSPFSAFVFKTIADPFVGKLSLFKVITGKLKSDSVVYNMNKEKQEKIGSIYFLRGKEQINVSEVVAGDIVAVSKLQYTDTGDTLSQKNFNMKYNKITFPKPMLSRAVFAASKGDEDKISTGLNKLLDEDPTFQVSRDTENAETIISGLGATHLEIIKNKLKNKFGISIELDLPKIPYRETIKKSVEIQGKHKKQSGGHGQYGDVKIKFEPRNDGEDELMFVDEIVGGVVPRQYIPAVEKGLNECIKHGVLAGYPVIRLKATLYDGSYHPVDSSEMAFKIAASLAYKKGLKNAKSILLEPIMHVDIYVPDEYMGDIMADVNKKRGKILGMEQEGGNQKIIAEIPQSELLEYTTDLKSMTGDRASFTMEFVRYEEVPEEQAKKIIESANEEKAE